MNTRRMLLRIGIVSSLLIIAGVRGNNCLPAAAKDKGDPDYIMDTSAIGQAENGYIRSEQLLELGSPTPGSLSLEGEQSLKEGSIDRALTVLQRSVEMAPLDMDARILYAQTLEKKLMKQMDKKSPSLYNFTVKQWYFVFQKSEYLDQKMQGLNGVHMLTGTQPKMFEKPHKFLARVLIPEDGSVKVVIGGKRPPQAKDQRKIAKKDDLDLDAGFKKDQFQFP